MRILPARADHVGCGTIVEDSQADGRSNRFRDGGKSLPLWHVPANSAGHSPRGTGRRGRSIAMSINRRTFVVRGTIAGAGLVLGLRLSPKALTQENAKARKKPVANPFDAWIHVKPRRENFSDRREIRDGAGNPHRVG